MNYYSTNRRAPEVSLREAVMQGLAPDGGLYMPQEIRPLPDVFYESLDGLTLADVAYAAAIRFFGDDVPADILRDMVEDTLSFPIPLVQVDERIFALELFHGPTLAFKDVGARFMARLLSYFIKKEGKGNVHVLVATSGDTGSAVANGFLGVPGIEVVVLYPKGKVSPTQEMQFTTLGRNITALEVDGTFDDCQRLVKSAFVDPAVNGHLCLTSANSINIARLLPQSFYYFHAVAQLRAQGITAPVVMSVPSGNFGNLTAGLIAHRMGLPVARFLAANNENHPVFDYLRTGVYVPHPSIATLANAMDVGDPSNFARMLDLYGGNHHAMAHDIQGDWFTNEMIADLINHTFRTTGYFVDPHGACAYGALLRHLRPGEVGIFLETAHPAKFGETMRRVTGVDAPVPQRLAEFMRGTKQSLPMSRDYDDFRQYLLQR